MWNEWGPTTTRTVDLGYDQLLVLRARRGTRVRVLYVHMWLTEEGDPRDVFAASGDEVALTAQGTAVIEGLGVTRVQVLEPGRTRRLARWLARQVRRVMARLPRRVPAGVTAPCA